MLEEFILAGYDLDTADAKGYTALILAAYHGHLASCSVCWQRVLTPALRICTEIPH